MRCKWFSVSGTLLSLILMALPCGVAMTFAPGPKERLVTYHSYLSFTPIGYGNWFPVLAVLFAILALMFLLTKRDYRQMAPICLGLSAASQVLSWFLFQSFTLTALAVVILQLTILLEKKISRVRLGQMMAVK